MIMNGENLHYEQSSIVPKSITDLSVHSFPYYVKETYQIFISFAEKMRLLWIFSLALVFSLALSGKFMYL